MKDALEPYSKSPDPVSRAEAIYSSAALERRIDRLDAQQQAFDTLDQRLATIAALIDRGHALLARTTTWIAAAKKAARSDK